MDLISLYKPSVDAEVGKFFMNKLSGKKGIEREAISKLEEFTMRGGKRIRPVFMILGYSLNSEVDQRIIKASVSLELMQSYLLIHDDIIDRSDVRRGGPSFHLLFNYEERVNEGLAIVCADLADAFSHEALLENDFPPDRLNNAMMLMSKTVEYTGIGQLMDITFPLGDSMTTDDVTAIHEFKTAHYTVNGPLKIGSILSGYPNPDKIDEYGIALGIAFQIKDDILGMFGDEKGIGKSIVGDFQEGKKTHLILYSYQLAREGDVKFIRERLGKKSISNSEFERVKKIVRNCGALEKTEELSKKYYEKAISSIDKITSSPERRREMREMAEIMVKRAN